MANYDALDLDWTWDGDILVGDDGDLADNRSDLILSLENEIRTVLRSEFNDWELHPTLGANLSQFRGEPNSRKNGKAIEQRVTSKIISAGIIQPEDITVRVVPVGREQVMISVNIQATSTPGNRLAIGEPLSINLVYDSFEDSVFFLQTSKSERDARSF